MIQVYADNVKAYDSRLASYDLLALSTTTGLNKGGTATITMPPGHPAYDLFTSMRTVVEIYRDKVLLFRGRALYPADDFYNQRTVTCEGELCFFDDSVSRPYLYQSDPADIFAQLVAVHNAQVDKFKQFKVGTVTVTDANDYIRLESESAETVLATLNKLLERCGGYFVFTTDEDGARVINWYAELDYRSQQAIEFGSNLLSFSRSNSGADLATAVLPYGAKDEETGTRVTIESVNDGLDFIQDDEAVALRGMILKPVTWDDVTDPANLLTKARLYLLESRNVITSLTLTALDLSYLDKNFDSFRVGDTIRVKSKPHKVDEDFTLSELTENLLNPAQSSITLGKDKSTLTGADVAGDVKSQSELSRVVHQVQADMQLNNAQIIEDVQQTLSSLIQQTSEEILLEVSNTYATNDRLTELVSTTFSQLSDSFNFLFTELKTTVDANDAEAREQFRTIEKYIRFVDGAIILGESGNELELRIENDRISFMDGGAEVAYFSNKQLVVLDGHFLNSLRVGHFAWLPRANGNLSLVKVSD